MEQLFFDFYDKIYLNQILDNVFIDSVNKWQLENEKYGGIFLKLQFPLDKLTQLS